ncbi:hypothetical protein D9M72_482070 [compost metagenome]
MLANGEQGTVLHDQTSIPTRIRRLKADHHHVVAGGKAITCGLQRLRRDQRRVAEDDENVVIAFCNGVTRGKHRVPRTQPFLLQIGRDRHAADIGRRRNRFRIATDHQGNIGNRSACQRLDDMSDHRPAGDRMQHLRHGRFHPRAFTRSQNDGQARPFHTIVSLVFPRQTPPAQFLKSKSPQVQNHARFGAVVSPRYCEKHNSHNHVALTGLKPDDGIRRRGACVSKQCGCIAPRGERNRNA